MAVLRGGVRVAGLGGSLERAVMEALWEAEEPLRVRQLMERLNEGAAKRLAYNTVQTVADRLVNKGLLERWQDGLAFRYGPVRSREDYVAGLMIEAMAGPGERAAILARFAASVDAADARHLLAALRERTAGDAGGKEKTE